ncbi:MAG: leucine-rich repeat domain-containing protein [Alphaproteobacteria bacterium]|nr:leucine-rich repeat domain-containing protein [Alphaproteobacteria bacterium]
MKKMILILGLILSFNANAQTSGTCGTNCHWHFDTNSGKLNITGGTDGSVGIMDDFDFSDEITTQPWEQYRLQISSVDISGVENVGRGAFVFAYNLENVTFDSSVKNIENAAFNTTNIKSITLPDGLESIGGWVFENVPLENIILPDTLQNIGLYSITRVLSRLKKIQIVCKGENCDQVREVFDNYKYYDFSEETSKTTKVLFDNFRKANEKECNSEGYYFNGQTCLSKKNGVTCIGNYMQNNGFCNRRIYTINEAEKVSKKNGNIFRLRYK